MWILTRRFALAVALSTTVAAGVGRAQDEPAAKPAADPADLVRPEKDPSPKMVPDLPTIPWRHDRLSHGWTPIKTTPLPKDREGIWVLDFAFKPLRIQTVEVPGKGRKAVHYLYYKVVNRTAAPRPFYPQFIMVNERGQRIEDAVVPEAVPVVQNREDPSIPVRGAVNIMGVLPPSTKQGVDDAVFGVAVWDRWDTSSDRFSIYVRGLSDGYKEVAPPDGGKPIVKYKTLRLDFIRRGDDRNISEKEIEPNEPPYEWVYW
ncbi:hypothetical protein [Paludisphaera mucosa]|uniref:Uncharacterized protein n=1 Tax=Paludisphaera mucosa TaxID=3030827 RepID=A0ABT6FCC4_9BACT|nr:hypothetical protein [Paludisphaera mucosa]MDG3005243.1 hypothetical protein [Paludisphaera mucosa]